MKAIFGKRAPSLPQSHPLRQIPAQSRLQHPKFGEYKSVMLKHFTSIKRSYHHLQTYTLQQPQNLLNRGREMKCNLKLYSFKGINMHLSQAQRGCKGEQKHSNNENYLAFWILCCIFAPRINLLYWVVEQICTPQGRRD